MNTNKPIEYDLAVTENGQWVLVAMKGGRRPNQTTFETMRAAELAIQNVNRGRILRLGIVPPILPGEGWRAIV